jgi:hypothetical protein
MMPSKKSLDAIVASMERAVAQAKRSSSELLRALRSADSYSRAELLVLGDADPTRGQLCHHCGLRIPEFADLKGTGRRRVLELIRNERRIMAIQELQMVTGCSLRRAKLWVHHAGRPLALRPGPPCPSAACRSGPRGRSFASIAAPTGTATRREILTKRVLAWIRRRAATRARTRMSSGPARSHTA